ncbi:MAG: hypothetical protein KY432_04345, partial [Acidobacteria bacterium]|nr:hypothetical protein [Acidobacteriota bacterium]
MVNAPVTLKSEVQPFTISESLLPESASLPASRRYEWSEIRLGRSLALPLVRHSFCDMSASM